MWDVAISVSVILLHAAVILAVLVVEQRQPSATLAWMLSIAFLPGVGLGAYLLFGMQRAKRMARTVQGCSQRVQGLLDKHHVTQHLAQSERIPPEARTDDLLALGRRLASTPHSFDNHCRILPDAEQTYASMQDAIETARHHVHVEFYIIQPDATGRALRDLLVQRARAGIEVRVLYDAVGSILLPSGFWRELEQAGGEVEVFRPIWKLIGLFHRRYRLDFRNHRKIVVVDGEVGFTGGINIGREYLGLDRDVGDWRDTHVRIDGPAVLSLQAAFAEDWSLACDRMLDSESYFPEPPPDRDGGHVVQIVDSGPDRTWSPIAFVHAHAIALARQRLWLSSPYFVPAPQIEDALISAALRGVDVRLLLPSRSDSLVVQFAARSYYPRLLEAGVRIFEYERGFLHAKTLLADDWVGSIGSANMDMRSFHLNFELNAFVHGPDFCAQLADQFEQDLDRSREVTLDVVRRRSFPKRLLCATARLLSPLL